MRVCHWLRHGSTSSDIQVFQGEWPTPSLLVCYGKGGFKGNLHISLGKEHKGGGGAQFEASSTGVHMVSEAHNPLCVKLLIPDHVLGVKDVFVGNKERPAPVWKFGECEAFKKKKKNPSSSSSLLNFIAPPSYDIYNGACRGESRWFTLVMTFLAVIIIETIISWVMTHSGWYVS